LTRGIEWNGKFIGYITKWIETALFSKMWGWGRVERGVYFVRGGGTWHSLKFSNQVKKIWSYCECRVVTGEDGNWMQEEVLVDDAATNLKYTPLTDEWIQLCLECALQCKPPNYSRWQDFYDVVTGRPPYPSLVS